MELSLMNKSSSLEERIVNSNRMIVVEEDQSLRLSMSFFKSNPTENLIQE